VEWFLYITFFVSSSYSRNPLFTSVLMAIAGFSILPFNPNIGRGLILFYFSFSVWWLYRTEKIGKLGKYIILVCVFSACILFSKLLPEIILQLSQPYQALLIDKSIEELIFIICCVPIIVYVGADINISDLRAKKICATFGQISYPMYLFHFPIQLFMVNIMGIYEAEKYLTLLVYLVLVVMISFAYSFMIDPLISEFKRQYIKE